MKEHVALPGSWHDHEPSRANQEVFNAAVTDIAAVSQIMLANLVVRLIPIGTEASENRCVRHGGSAVEHPRDPFRIAPSPDGSLLRLCSLALWPGRAESFRSLPPAGHR